jgi:hypothetical protein
VFAVLDRNPLEKPRVICIVLGFDYKKHGRTVANCKTEWKCHFKLGLGSKCPTSQHHVHAFCYVPKTCDRASAVATGWDLSRNRNKMLCWNRDRSSLGRVEWTTKGRVLTYIKKPQTMIRVKQLLVKAFFETGLIFDSRVLGAFLDSVHWKGADDVYATAERLPYMVIDNYVDSHGIRILVGDVTHPNAIEVQWVHPDWLERLELTQQQNIKVIETDSQVLKMNSEQIQQFSSLLKDLSQPKAPSPSDRSVV